MRKLAFIAMLMAVAFYAKAQVCPLNFSATISTTAENVNNSDGSCAITNINWANSPYTYSWSSSETTSSISGKVSGTYSVTISNTLGCEQILCAFIPRDSFPCEPDYLIDYNISDLPIYTQFQTLINTNQTGILVEIYDASSNLVHKAFYNYINPSSRFQFQLYNEVYYNKTYKMVTKNVFGSDTSNFCGDTVSFTVQDFQCDLNYNAQNFTISDTIVINYQHFVTKYPHTTQIYYHIFDMNDNLIKTVAGTSNGSTGYYKQLQADLYYNESYKVTYSSIFNNTDSVPGCDTAIFVVQDFKCDFDWRGTCADTIQATHQIRVSNWYHFKDVYLELYDGNNNFIKEILMIEGAGGTRYIITQNHVSNGNDYIAKTYVVYEHPRNSTTDTIVSCADSCKFHVDPSGVAIAQKSGFGSSVSHQLNPAKVFPNPTRDRLNINYTLPGVKTLNAKVYNKKGQLVKEFRGKSENSKYEMDTSDLSNGIYFIQLDNGHNIESIPFSIVK